MEVPIALLPRYPILVFLLNPMQAGQTELSYWEKCALSEAWDFVIVGAGVTGLNAALEIKRRNPRTKVLVLEARSLGTVASTRNAGFLCLGSPSELLADYDNLGEDALINLLAAKWAGIQRTLYLLGGNAVGLRNVRGYEVLAMEKSPYSYSVPSHDAVISGLPSLNAVFESAADLALPFTPKRRQKGATRHKPLPTPYFGEWHPFRRGNTAHTSPWGPEAMGLIPMAWEGQINPFLLRESLLRYARNLGIRIQEGLEFVQRDGQGLVVKPVVPMGKDVLQNNFNSLNINAKYVIYATNALTKDLQIDLSDSVIPQRGQMWATAPLKAADIARLNGNFHADRGYLYARTHAGRLLLGGGRNQDFASEQTTEWSENQRISEYLKAYSVDVLGLAPDLEWESRWSGTMGFTQSGLPHCLVLQNGDWLVAGMNGMGMALGPEMGRRVACLALQVKA